MTYLKRWAESVGYRQGLEEGRATDIGTPILDQKPPCRCVSYPARDTPGLAEDKRAEALELLGWLTYFYNERAAFLEYDSGLSRAEAERLAMIETKATEGYQRWQQLR
jgi:hypothetical protein